MRILTLIHILLIAILLSAMGYCSRDVFEGPEPRLLVKEYGAPDSKYASEVTVYLNGHKGSQAWVDINTNYQWCVDDYSFHMIPGWCQVSIPSGSLITGFVTDKTLIFTDKGDNLHPFVEKFDLTLRNSQDPNVKVTIHIYRNVANDVFDVFDYGAITIISAFKAKPGSKIGINGDGQNLLFELHTSKEWKLIIRPTGVNKEEIVDWIDVEIDGAPAPISTFGTYGIVTGPISLSATPPDIVPIKLTIQANPSDRYPRTAEIELLATTTGEGVSSIKIPITQQPRGAILSLSKAGASPVDYTLSGDASTGYTIEVPALNPNNVKNNIVVNPFVESNRNWTAMVNPGADWLSIDPITGSLDPMLGLFLQNISLTATPNTDPNNDRTATITFAGEYVLQGVPVSDLTATVIVKQPKFVPVLDIISGEFPSKFAGTGALPHTITFKCSFDFTVDFDTHLIDATSSPDLGLSVNGDLYTFKFKINDNGGSERSGTIGLNSVNPAYSAYNKVVNITQDHKWILTFSPNSLSFPIGSGTLSLSAPTALTFTVESSSSYIGGHNWTATISPTSNLNIFAIGTGGSGTNGFSLTGGIGTVIRVQPTNATLAAGGRSWQITFTVPNSTYSATYSVTQKTGL